WHGHLIDLPSLREKSGAGSRGVTMRQLARLADSLRLSSRAVALEVAELKRLRLPCILHWDMNHFVVLTRIGRRGSTIVDPASGRRVASWREIGRRFTGVAIELWPDPAFRKQSNTRTIRLRTLLGR